VGPPGTALLGAVDVNVIVWLDLPTPNDCCACGAALKFALPAWLASMMQVPVAVKLTVEPLIEHTDAAVASMVKVTGSPDVDVAVTAYVGPPGVALLGAVDVKLIVCEPLPTAKDCCACGAALKFALPAWLASMTQVPAPVKLTVAPLIEHTELALASIVKLTASPDDAVAATAYVGPPTTAVVGADDVKVIVCEPLPTANDCCTCGAALKLVFPAWLASMTHVPTALKLTVEPLMEHTEVALESMVKVTVSPDVAVAVTVYVGPATAALVGAVEVKVMVWLDLPTPNDCCACGAAL
jgi:hypothetical protein